MQQTLPMLCGSRLESGSVTIEWNKRRSSPVMLFTIGTTGKVQQGNDRETKPCEPCVESAHVFDPEVRFSPLMISYNLVRIISGMENHP